MLGVARSAALRFVCSDMWKPYLKVVVERAGQAVHVLDRFHIMSHFSKAIDEVRAVEARKLAAEACPRMGVSGGGGGGGEGAGRGRVASFQGSSKTRREPGDEAR